MFAEIYTDLLNSFEASKLGGLLNNTVLNGWLAQLLKWVARLL